MNIIEFSARRFSVLLSVALAGGCILTTSQSDGTAGDATGDGGSFDDGSGTTSNPTTVSDSSNDDSVDSTTGPGGDCSANLVLDPGFEGGTPSQAWTEASDNFGTPICDASCTDEANAGPYAGDWYAWFGGVETAEHSSVSQNVTIAASDNAVLQFRFAIAAAGSNGDDAFTVTIDGTTVFMVTDDDMADYPDYTRVDVDITDFADGGSHSIRFAGDFPGTGLSNFFLDEVSLVTCNPTGTDSSTGAATTDSGGSTSTSGPDTGGTTDTGTDSGSTSSGSSTDTGGSSTGGSAGTTTM